MAMLLEILPLIFKGILTRKIFLKKPKFTSRVHGGSSKGFFPSKALLLKPLVVLARLITELRVF